MDILCSATFKDLGERKNGQKTEYAVECSFLGETTVGTGTTRTDARETACKLMAEKIGIGKKKKTTKAKNKAAAKPKPAQKPDLIAKHGEVDSVDEWGKRRLAYEIDHKTEGYYVLVNFKSDADFPAELNRVMGITDGILRCMVIRK